MHCASLTETNSHQFTQEKYLRVVFVLTALPSCFEHRRSLLRRQLSDEVTYVIMYKGRPQLLQTHIAAWNFESLSKLSLTSRLKRQYSKDIFEKHQQKDP